LPSPVPPIVRLPPRSNFEVVLGNASRLAVVGLGLIGLTAVLIYGQYVLMPVTLGVIVGLMFSPIAGFLERRGIPAALSAGLVVILFLVLIGIGIMGFAMPLSDWVGRVPAIWARLQEQLANWQEPLESLSTLEGQITGVFGNDEAMEVTVDSAGPMLSMAAMAPSFLGQVALFLASLFFFLATRQEVRCALLSLCVSRRLRWRTAHIFRDIEEKVSRYLLSITLINIVEGFAVFVVMSALGMPSPILWGVMAGILNYITYVGALFMFVIFLAIGFASYSSIEMMLLPAFAYIVINFIEGQFVFPFFVGKRLTLNPFVIFLSITFWLWIWGPVGGFIAVPATIIVMSMLSHMLPTAPRTATGSGYARVVAPDSTRLAPRQSAQQALQNLG